MKSKNTIALAVLCLFTTGLVFAKLPPSTDAQKATAEEAKLKAAEVAKKEAELLAKSQDSVANRYIQAQKAKGVTVKPTPIAVATPAPPAAPTAAPAKKN
jgi:hypothetical protein